MSRVAAVLVLMGLVGIGVVHADKPPVRPVSYESLKKEMADAQKKFIEDYQKEVETTTQAYQKAIAEAKTDAEKKEAKKKVSFPAFSYEDSPVPTFAPRFLAWAKQNPKDPQAFDALVEALQTSMGPDGKAADTWTATLAELQARHADDTNVRLLIRMLARQDDSASSRFLQTVIDKNPDRRTKGLAARSMVRGKETAVMMVTLLKTNPAYRQTMEKRLGKEAVEKRIANVDHLKTEAEVLQKQFQKNYGDLFPELAIGKPAPEVVSRDLEGKTVRLSDLKGKVVVLDIWATWCGPCRQMIPHEREMTARLKDKPFTLVSISSDDQVETLKKFLEKEKMPWTHWWNGSKGGIIEDWDIQGYPTIYVIDAKGVIRFTDIRDKELEEAVVKLVQEAEVNH